MSWFTTGIIFVIVWWLVLFVVLPFGAQPLDSIQPGHAPHQPCHLRSGQGPRTGPNMLRPRIQAPTLAKLLAAKSSSIPVVPVSPSPCMRLNVRVGSSQA
jgi:predicted secreted protein